MYKYIYAVILAVGRGIKDMRLLKGLYDRIIPLLLKDIDALLNVKAVELINSMNQGERCVHTYIHSDRCVDGYICMYVSILMRVVL